MRKSSFKVVLIAAALLTGPLFLQAAPLQVLSAAPKGNLGENSRKAVSVTFNQPVAALSEDSEFASADCPITIIPKVKGTCRFTGTQTVLFEPEENWPVASYFTAQIKAGFTSRVSGEKLAKSYAFSFTTTRPEVRGTLPHADEHWISLNPTLFVRFNLPMSPAKASAAYLQDPAGNRIPLEVRSITQKEFDKDFSYLNSIQQVLAFTPKKTLQKDTLYTLTLPAGLRAASGTLGLAQNYQTRFVTYPDLKALGISRRQCLPYTPSIRFSSPVRLSQLLAGMKVSPQESFTPPSESMLDSLGSETVLPPLKTMHPNRREYILDNYDLTPEEKEKGAAFFETQLSFLNLEPGKSVTITLDKNIQDIYGGRLGKDYTFTIENDGYCPRVDFSGGFGVLESYLPARLPIKLVNIPSLEVVAARFNKENYIPFAKQETRHCAKKPLEKPTYQGTYEFADNSDKISNTYLDLKRFDPTAQDSIIFSQIWHEKQSCWISSTDNLTDVGITFKTSPQNILLWATSLETGLPLPNLAVELRDKTNNILWSGSTDMHGLARAPGWSQLDIADTSTWGSPTLYAFVSSAGGDGVISTELDDGLEPWRFNIPYNYNPKRDAFRTEMFTERGVYRPGETVYLKGVARRRQNEGWSVPKELRGKVKVMDATYTEIFTQPVSFSNDMGTFDTSFTVPASAHTGQWEVVFTPEIKGEKDPASTYTYFRVETAKEASFKIALQPQKNTYISGETARFNATANYQFGAPLSQAPAQWTLRREMAWFSPKEFKEYTFTPYFLREDEYKENNALLASSSKQTDDKGAVSFEASLPQVTAPIHVFAEVGVQSPARQDLFSRTSIFVHPASFYLGAKPASDRNEVGKPVEASVIAVTTDKKPTRASVTAQIRKRDWHSVRKVGLSGRLEWINEKEEIELPSQTLEVTEKGATLSFTPQESGNYYITLLSKDAAGRQVLGGFDVMVYGKNGASWKQNDEDILTLKQDKDTYQVGQKARINVQSPYETATALVTVEREGILDSWTTTVKGGSDYVDVPIKANYLPNVYVSIVLVKGRSAAPVTDDGIDLGKPQGKIGYAKLNVAPVSKKISVEVQTAKKNYRPGDNVSVTVNTKLGKKGVPAEVTLFVVDEGILALSNYKTPDLFTAFYNTVPLSVLTADNRAYVIGQRNFGEKGENRGGGGSADAKLGGVDLRARFSFVPYFMARLKTTAKGKAKVSFTLPDNLTKFRIMAVAVRPQEFGAGETEIQVSKPLMVMANLPQIARKGDSFLCSALVYNYEDKKGNFEVSAQSEGTVQLTGESVQSVEVPLGQAREVSWPCQAQENGSAKVAFRVKGRQAEDGVLAQIQVLPVEQKQTLALYANTQKSQEELLDKPGQVTEDSANRVVFSLASTALLNLKGAMVYLMTYPYDCLEQQMSKIVPVIEGMQLVEDFGLASDAAALKKRTQEILNNIPAYQHMSGGFGYWKDSMPDPYVTAYVLEVCSLARKAGYNVPEKNLQEAANWLEKSFNKNQQRAFTYSNDETQTARAYSAYVLALYGKPVAAAFNNLYASKDTLPLTAVAYTLKTSAVLKSSSAIQKQLAQRILNRVVHTPLSVYFTVPTQMPWLHLNDVSATALSLDALLEAGQPFAQSFEVVSWLLKQLNAQGNWNSTSENAAVFRALNRYYNTLEATTPDFTAEVSWNKAEPVKHTFQGRSTNQVLQTIPFQDVYGEGTEARFKFSKTGQGTLFYSLAQEYEPKAYTKRVNAGFEVSRRITTPEGKPVTSLQAGKPYRITLTVRSAAARHFVVVEDFIPSGVEIINTELATASQNVREGGSYSFGRVERYQDRISAFADYLPEGTHEFSYLVNATVRGEFSYPSAWASLMYEPAVFGRNETSTIKIQ